MGKETRGRFGRFMGKRPNNLNQVVELENYDFLVPVKYLDVDNHGHVYTNDSLYAGYAFELMVKKRPGLLEAALKARSDPKMLAGVVREINALSPGLYIRLRELQYNEIDFKKGIQMILDALG